jgi:hypothetical protein
MMIGTETHGMGRKVADDAIPSTIPAAPYGAVSAAPLASSLLLGELLLLIGP